MEYIEGESRQWNPLKQSHLVHSHHHTANFKPVRLHPSSCCLCAISSSEVEEGGSKICAEIGTFGLEEGQTDDERVGSSHLYGINDAENCADENEIKLEELNLVESDVEREETSSSGDDILEPCQNRNSNKTGKKTTQAVNEGNRENADGDSDDGNSNESDSSLSNGSSVDSLCEPNLVSSSSLAIEIEISNAREDESSNCSSSQDLGGRYEIEDVTAVSSSDDNFASMHNADGRQTGGGSLLYGEKGRSIPEERESGRDEGIGEKDVCGGDIDFAQTIEEEEEGGGGEGEEKEDQLRSLTDKLGGSYEDIQSLDDGNSRSKRLGEDVVMSEDGDGNSNDLKERNIDDIYSDESGVDRNQFEYFMNDKLIELNKLEGESAPERNTGNSSRPLGMTNTIDEGDSYESEDETGNAESGNGERGQSGSNQGLDSSSTNTPSCIVDSNDCAFENDAESFDEGSTSPAEGVQPPPSSTVEKLSSCEEPVKEKKSIEELNDRSLIENRSATNSHDSSEFRDEFSDTKRGEKREEEPRVKTQPNQSSPVGNERRRDNDVIRASDHHHPINEQNINYQESCFINDKSIKNFDSNYGESFDEGEIDTGEVKVINSGLPAYKPCSDSDIGGKKAGLAPPSEDQKFGVADGSVLTTFLVLGENCDIHSAKLCQLNYSDDETESLGMSENHSEESLKDVPLLSYHQSGVDAKSASLPREYERSSNGENGRKMLGVPLRRVSSFCGSLPPNLFYTDPDYKSNIDKSDGVNSEFIKPGDRNGEGPERIRDPYSDKFWNEVKNDNGCDWELCDSDSENLDDGNTDRYMNSRMINDANVGRDSKTNSSGSETNVSEFALPSTSDVNDPAILYPKAVSGPDIGEIRFEREEIKSEGRDENGLSDVFEEAGSPGGPPVLSSPQNEIAKPKNDEIEMLGEGNLRESPVDLTARTELPSAGSEGIKESFEEEESGLSSFVVREEQLGSMIDLQSGEELGLIETNIEGVEIEGEERKENEDTLQQLERSNFLLRSALENPKPEQGNEEEEEEEEGKEIENERPRERETQKEDFVKDTDTDNSSNLEGEDPVLNYDNSEECKISKNEEICNDDLVVTYINDDDKAPSDVPSDDTNTTTKDYPSFPTEVLNDDQNVAIQDPNTDRIHYDQEYNEQTNQTQNTVEISDDENDDYETKISDDIPSTFTTDFEITPSDREIEGGVEIDSETQSVDQIDDEIDNDATLARETEQTEGKDITELCHEEDLVINNVRDERRISSMSEDCCTNFSNGVRREMVYSEGDFHSVGCGEVSEGLEPISDHLDSNSGYGSVLVRSINSLCGKGNWGANSEGSSPPIDQSFDLEGDGNHPDTCGHQHCNEPEQEEGSDVEDLSCDSVDCAPVGLQTLECQSSKYETVDYSSPKVESGDSSTLPTIREEREDLSLVSCGVGSTEGDQDSLSLPPDVDDSTLSEMKELTDEEGVHSRIIECDEDDNDDGNGFRIIVGNVTRKIPDFVLYMQDEHVDMDDEESTGIVRSDDKDIVMLNDDESFITVVEDKTPVRTEPDCRAFSDDDDDNAAVRGSSNRRLDFEDDEGFEVYDGDRIQPATSTESLPALVESTSKTIHRYNDTLKKKLSRVEKRLSTISMNIFHQSHVKSPPSEDKEKAEEAGVEDPRPVSKGRRPLSGVRKKLASSRRRVYKLREEKNSQQVDPDKGLNDQQPPETTLAGGYPEQGVRAPTTRRRELRIISPDEEKRKWAAQRKRRCVSHHELLLPSSSSNSFGKRSQGGGRRPNECLILEPSEMMVIDYPDVQLLHPGQRSSANPRTFEKLHFALDHHRELSLKGASGVVVPPQQQQQQQQQLCSLNPSSAQTEGGPSIHFHGNGPPQPQPPPPPHLHHPNHHHPHHHHHNHHHHHEHLPDLLLRGGRSRGSVGSSVRDGSDTSSAYSGSDTMCQSIHSLDHEDVDLSGLMESVVDSDEEDLVENVESLSVQDTVRECLEKDPSDRTENDIKVLLEFTERLSAFANFTVGVRRAMCQAMVFAVVEEADTILMNDGEELDSWSVIINGHVEVTHPDGTVHKLHLGDSFGITPTMEKLYHRGVMRSKVNDCQFVCIRQSDYYRILRQGEENTRRHEEDGVLVLVTEKSHIDTCHREANIVIKGTAERLMLHLVEVENILDTTYVEDFLLTHRKFIENSVVVAKKLLEWFDDPKYQDIVTRVFLRWVQSYFTDFEMDPDMMNCLEKFEHGLKAKEMNGQLFFLRMVCMTKARAREVTLTRPSRDTPLQFTIVGRKNFGIFISSVEKGSKAEEVGLKRADQILEANGQSFANIAKNEALEILKSNCHLAITVRSNLHTFNDMLQTPENAHKGKNNRKTSDLAMNGSCQGHLDFVSTLNLNTALSPQLPHNRKEAKGTLMTLKTHKFKEFLASIVTNKSNIISDQPVVCSDDSVSSHSSTGGHLYRSRSNPDLSTTEYEENGKSEFPDHVLKVYRATDHSARFLPVHKETTAREVVMLALSLFNIAEPSQNYALYEVSATEGPAGNERNVKQKKLPDGLQNLAERIGLGSRYYLKSVTSSQNQYSDEIVNELLRESQVSLLQLNSVVELAIQLTLEDFAIFRQIEPTEYIDNLFKLNSRYGTPALSKFEQISNRELFWVCTEVCSEHNIHKRAKVIKQFIKIAKYCKDLNNFNSMFAILSGLGSISVNRLRQTWARVPNRYRKIFSDLETVMDPSQNMKNYRKLANTSFSQSPMIPFYPIVKKDLLFLNEGNDDEVDGLINFEKLRTISKSIRKLGEMCSTKYCPNKMLEKLGQPQSTAMTAMNQGITGSQQSSTVKRRKKSTAQPDKKKMFEEAQMVRRVKAYLSQLKVITDEDTLIKMSYECEPPSSSHSGGGSSSHVGVSSTSSSSLSSGQQSGSNSAPPSNPQTRRRHHSPTPSTASSNSSNSLTSEGKKTHARFGAASPSSERKMLSLAEATKKPYHGPRPPTTATALSQSSMSPNPSPGALRRGPAPAIPTSIPCPPVVRHCHERSHSDIPVSSVDLNAESSSVTSLSSFANLRKSHTSGSMASNGCQGNQGEPEPETPSTHFDCHTNITATPLDGGGEGPSPSHLDNHFTSPNPPSPPSHHRRLSHQTVSFKPPFPHAVAVLPPIPPDAACGSRFLRRGVSGGPPDYTSTQMRIQHLGRALSHDAVHYYHSRHEDEEEEAQVSAV